MSPARQFLLYSLLRVGLFAVVFAALLLMQVNPFLAAVIAAIVGLCVTYIFFRRQRDEVTRAFAHWRTSDRADRDDDGDEEDELVGEPASSAPPRSDGTSPSQGPLASAGPFPSERSGASERQSYREAGAVEERGEARELEREHELRSGASGERDDHGGQRRQ